MTMLTHSLPAQEIAVISKTSDQDLLASFPLIPGTKNPSIPWRQVKVGQYPAAGNYGIALQPADLILDFDPRNYPAGRSLHDEFFKAYPGIRTRIVKTPRGGFHVYLKKPLELCLKKSQKNWPGVDFLSDGHYVCGLGTSTVEGKDRGTGVYELLGEAPICDAPADFLAGLEQQAGPVASQGAEPTLSCEADFRSICETAEPAIRGSRGITSFKLSCQARDLGLPAEVAYQHMRNSWLPRWPEPFMESELHTQVDHAYRYAKNAPGCKTPEAVFTPEMALVAGSANNVVMFPPLKETGLPVRFPNSVFPRTDSANATWLAENFKHRIRWCAAEKRWLAWDDTRWRHDNTERPIACAKNTAKILFSHAKNDDERKWSARSASVSGINAMLALAKDELAVTPAELDRDSSLLNCLNGTVDLKTLELRPHQHQDLITKLSPVAYDPEAKAPRFEQFMQEIFGESAELVDFVQRALGYCLTGSVAEQKLLVAHGAGQNGKSTLFTAVREILGDYAIETDPTLLINKQRGTSSEDVYQLKGTRFATTIESDEEVTLNEAKVKQLTGGDSLNASLKYGHLTVFDPTHKLWLVTNHLPGVNSQGVAMWRRIRLIPFKVQVPDERKDKGLPEKLRTEYPGILAWLVRGCQKWRESGLTEPPEVMHATEVYKKSEDHLARFIEEKCSVHASLQVQASVLQQEYVLWCGANGEAPHSRKALPKRLQEKNFTQKQDSTGSYRVWCGLELKGDIDASFKRFI